MIIIDLMTETPNTDTNFVNVLDNLYSISKSAIETLNSKVSNKDLSIYKLPTEFLEMFLDIPGRRGGFCIISPSKMVTFFDEDPNLITVIGKNRNKKGAVAQVSSKTTQLLKLSFSNVGGKYEYKDNTGGAIDPTSIVDIIVNWVQSN